MDIDTNEDLIEMEEILLATAAYKKVLNTSV